MKIVKPIAMTAGMLTAHSIAETDYAAWSGATTYAAGDHVISTATHRIYESAAAGNIAHDPTTDDGTWWVDIAPTTRWAMFDGAVGSVSSAASTIVVTLTPGQIIDSLVLLDVTAASVEIEMLDEAAGGVVYAETYDLTGAVVIDDWWLYFTEPFGDPVPYVAVNDLPAYYSGEITVAISGSGTVSVGTLAIGRATDLGDTERLGSRIGIVDYSRKTTDDFGVTTLTERAYAKRASVPIVINNDRLDAVARALAAIRATAVIFISNQGFDALVIYGWLREWGVVIAYSDQSELSLDIEGLT